MTQRVEKEIKMYDGKVYGIEVSKRGLESGYLDYLALSNIVGDCILNNNIVPFIGHYEWELVNGFENESDEIYQYYIITDSGYRFLEDYTEEIVYYHDELDMYVLGITHYGTSWDYVLTDIKLV